jgi:hypothetical protein
MLTRYQIPVNLNGSPTEEKDHHFDRASTAKYNNKVVYITDLKLASAPVAQRIEHRSSDSRQ